MPIAFLRSGVLPDTDVFRLLVTARQPMTMGELKTRTRLARHVLYSSLGRLERLRIIHTVRGSRAIFRQGNTRYVAGRLP